MEPVLDNRDEEEILRARRAERRERMKLEKQLQEQRRQMIRKFLPLGVSVIGIIITISIVIAVVSKPDAGQQQAQVAEQEIQQTQNLLTL